MIHFLTSKNPLAGLLWPVLPFLALGYLIRVSVFGYANSPSILEQKMFIVGGLFGFLFLGMIWKMVVSFFPGMDPWVPTVILASLIGMFVQWKA